MGILETELKKEKRLGKVQKTVLEVIKDVGILSVALVAPNALKMFSLFRSKPRNRSFSRDVVNESLKRLYSAGLVTFETNGQKKFVRLTQKGETRLRMAEAINFQIKKPKKWDKKWRVIIFDIPEKRKGLRNKLRQTLNVIGFVRLQDSVWVYPYDCEDLITLLKADFKVGKDILYMIVDKIENDLYLRRNFKI